MNIGILRLYTGNSGEIGYYNLQEVGLAKEFEKRSFNVYIFLLDKSRKTIYCQKLSKKIHLIKVPCRSINNHGIFNCEILKEYKLDFLQIQSDNQFYVPKVIKFCKKNNIKFYNYIGTLFSDSKNRFKKTFLGIISLRNIFHYRGSINFVKTPSIKKKLLKFKVDSEVVPVGLDKNIIPDLPYSEKEIRSNLKLPADKDILLFVGRLEAYKNPIGALKLIKKLDDEYVLLIIGKGSLSKLVDKFIKDNDLQDKVLRLESIPNREIHQYYKISKYYINMNSSEIFGMSILEAMYQKANVIALKAPGPNYIIEDKKSGFLVRDIEEMKDIIKYNYSLKKTDIINRVNTKFTWSVSVDKIIDELDINSSI